MPFHATKNLCLAICQYRHCLLSLPILGPYNLSRYQPHLARSLRKVNINAKAGEKAAEHYERTKFALYKDDICLVLTLIYVLMDNFLFLFRYQPHLARSLRKVNINAKAGEKVGIGN